MSQPDQPPANPYASPASNAGQDLHELSGPEPDDALITGATVEIVRKTRPWIIFFSVLGFLLSVIGIGVNLVDVIRTGAAGSSPVITTLIIALVYVLPSTLLWQLGDRMGRFVRRPELLSLDEVLRSQRTFWSVAGMVATLGFVLTCVGTGWIIWAF